MSIRPREFRKKGGMLTTYQKLIVDRIDKATNSFYADYDFIQQFITPYFSVLRKNNSKVAMSLGLAGLAERVYTMHQDERNCDDFLDLVLDSLVQNGYLTHYKFVGDVKSHDLKHADPVCKGSGTFDDLFKKGGSVVAKAARASFGAYSLTSKISDTHFIDTGMFIVGVGKWEVSFSPRAYSKKIRVGDFFEIVEYVSGKTSFTNLVTGEVTDISRKQKWSKEMVSFFSLLYERGIDRMYIEGITSLWGGEEYFVKTVKSYMDIESNQLKTLDFLLTGINPDDVYQYRENCLVIRAPIVVKEYGGG